MSTKRIVVIGGGTGTFTVLSGLKKYPVDLTAVVSMADDGGSTGILRDELGVLPPGDIRQCLVALSTSSKTLRELMNYRFSEGTLKGHSFGNIFLSAMEKMTGSFDDAVTKISTILRIQGKVIPATLDKVKLVARLKNNQLIQGQSAIHKENLNQLEKIYLEPEGIINPKAIQALKEADAIIVGPGDFYSSLIPNFLILGLPEAIVLSPAKKIYVCNLMTKDGHTDNFSPQNFSKQIEQYLHGQFDYIIYNNSQPPADLLNRYAQEGQLVKQGQNPLPENYIGADLINTKIPQQAQGDVFLKRNLIRHNSDRLAALIMKIIL